MSGRFLVVGLLGFTTFFAIFLYYFQVFAYYQTSAPLDYVTIQGTRVPVTRYIGIDSKTSGLKLRGCFFTDPTKFVDFEIHKKATPLSAPFWFNCFESGSIQRALDAGDAKAYLAVENEKDGIDRVVAIYPNGMGFQWRQLNSKYLD